MRELGPFLQFHEFEHVNRAGLVEVSDEERSLQVGVGRGAGTAGFDAERRDESLEGGGRQVLIVGMRTGEKGTPLVS